MPDFGHQGILTTEATPPPEAGGPRPERRHHALADRLRRLFGRRLRRVALDLGTTCPNRDGTWGRGGCVYCDADGSGTGAAKRGLDLETQWRAGLERLRRAAPEGPCAVLYFQSYSSTWPDLEPLAAALAWARTHADEAPVLAVSTRPDCFSEEAADLLASANDAFAEVWVEFGLETTDDAVQRAIGRHDTLANFRRACRLAGERGLTRVAHCLAGLPGERPDDLERQARVVAETGCEGVKFHQLMVLRRTRLAKPWLNGELELLAPDDYARRLARALAVLPWRVVVHRLRANAPAAERLSPLDGFSLEELLPRVHAELDRLATSADVETAPRG